MRGEGIGVFNGELERVLLWVNFESGGNGLLAS